jgi:hypothetical protein
MTKPTKTCAELREMILSEIEHDPRCPPGIDVVVRPDKDVDWTAEARPGFALGIAECMLQVARIVRWLRLQYGLARNDLDKSEAHSWLRQKLGTK